jgi:hypothetical protein
MQAGFVANVPELDREAHGARLRQWAFESCSDFCFLKGKGFMGVLRRPTTHKKLRQLIVNNLRNWHKKGELPEYVPRATYQHGWLETLTMAEYAARARKTRAYSEKVVGEALAAVLRGVHAGIDAKLLRAQAAQQGELKQHKKQKRQEREWAEYCEWQEREHPTRFAERTAPGGDIELTPALRAAIDEERSEKRRRVR